MPLPQDLVTRIINVQWGGGIFIAGSNQNSNIYYLNLNANEKSNWRNLGTLDFHQFYPEGPDTGWVQGSSFALISEDDEEKRQPVFILVGGGGTTESIGLIMASRDGLKWSRVFTLNNEPAESAVGANIFAIVWDGSYFWAGGHQSENFFDHDSETGFQAETDILLRSSNGFSWHEVGRHETRIDYDPFTGWPDWPEYNTGLLAAHCSSRVKDVYDNGLPDGFYGYDETAQLLIAPAELPTIDYFFGGVRQGGPDITITNSGTGPSPPSDPDIPVACVAHGGTFWVAAGGVMDFPSTPGSTEAALLESTEDGLVWTNISPAGETDGIITLCGGLVSVSL